MKEVASRIKKQIQFFILILLFIPFQPLFSMNPKELPPPTHSQNRISTPFMRSGVFHGGTAKSDSPAAFSLLKIEKGISKENNKDQWVSFHLGDSSDRPLKNRIGYYHVSIDPFSLGRISIDLAQFIPPRFSPSEVKKMFHSSEFIKDVETFYDNLDHSLNVSFYFKLPCEVKITEVVSKNNFSQIRFEFRSGQ